MLSQPDLTLNTAYFIPLDSFPETQPNFSQLQVLAECPFTRPSKPEHGVTANTTQPIYLLQVAQDWILQCTPDRLKIISYFKCDYEVQFQILRKISPVPNRLGQAQGIRFIFKANDGKMVELAVKPQHRVHLEVFGRILGRKFIVQLGFHTSFKAIKKIGKGMTACVYNAVNFANGRQVAIKSFKRSVYFAQDNGNGKISFCKQFKILTLLNHKNLCQIYSVYQTDNSTYVILELYPLSLYGYLQKHGFPKQNQAKILMSNLLEGIAYLHDKGIMHRDLKLQNIMVKKDETNGTVIPVIVDLGLAEYVSNKKYLYTRCGTPGYVAPEVLKIKSTDQNQTYGCPCDIFSLGIIFHILMFKKPLFQGKDVKEVIKKNCECQISFDNDNFKNISPQARELFQRMLCRDPSKRITARQALLHPYFCGQKVTALEQQSVIPTNCSIKE